MKSSVLQPLTLLLRVVCQCVRIASRFGMNGWSSCKISPIISVCTFYRNNFGKVLLFVISLRFSFSKVGENFFFIHLVEPPAKFWTWLSAVSCGDKVCPVASQCKGPGFDSWVGPFWVQKQFSLCLCRSSTVQLVTWTQVVPFPQPMTAAYPAITAG